MDIFLSLIIPIVILFSGYLALSYSSFFKKYNFFLRLAISLVLGLSFVIFPLMFVGLFLPLGFVFTSKIIFVSTSLLAIIAMYRIKRKSIRFKFSVFPVDYTLLLIFCFVAIYLLLFALRPVVDADIIESYLPLARSIILSDNIPKYNYYDNRTFVIPPAGGPVLFAYYYALSGNITSEIFRFTNVPFFLGLLVLTYFIMKEFFSKKLSLLGVLVLLMIPFTEDIIFNSGLYVDMAFAFLATVSFWLTTRFFKLKKENISSDPYILLGLALAQTMLFKYQAVFLYIIIFFLLALPCVRRQWRYILFPFIYTPWFLGFIAKSNPFQKPNMINYFIITVLLTSVSYLFLKRKQVVYSGKNNKILLTFAISLLGLSFVIRNLFVFGGLSEVTLERAWVGRIQPKIGVLHETGTSMEAWSIFIAPWLALFWLIPKVQGLLKGLLKQNTILPFFILISWYSYWVLFLGSVVGRWLLPIIVYIVLFIILGLKSLFKNTITIEKIVWVSVPFKLLSSTFIFRNLGVFYLGGSRFREMANMLSKGEQLQGVNSSIFAFLPPFITSLGNFFENTFVKLLFIMTSRTSFDVNDITFLIGMGIGSFAVICLLAKYFDKLKLRIIIILLIFASYGYIFYTVSGGDLRTFGKREQSKLFDYWGQNTFLVPYLKANAKSGDRVVIYGIPSGLSYYTNLKVYNLEYGGGLAVFYSIFDEKNMENIYQFFKKNNIRYVGIREYGESKERFKRLKRLTRIFDVLDYSKYTKLVIEPSDQSYWRLYEIL